MSLEAFFAQVSSKDSSAKKFERKIDIVYLSDGDLYLRLIPYKDEHGTSKLYRTFYYHRIPMNVKVKDKDGNEEIQLKSKIVPCQGKGCKFCEIAKKLKDEGVKDSYKYSYVKDYIAMGSVMQKQSGIGFVPVDKTDTGKAKVSALVISGMRKQTRGFDALLTPDELTKLEDSIPSFMGQSPIEIVDKVFSPVGGNVLALSNKKNEVGHWVSTVKVLPTVYDLVEPKPEVNLDLDVFSGYSDEFISDALAALRKIAENLLGFKGTTLEVKEETPASSKETAPWESSDKKINAFELDTTTPVVEKTVTMTDMEKEAADIFGMI